MKKSLILKISVFLSFIFIILLVSLSYLNLDNQKKELSKSFLERAQATSYSLQACIVGKEDFKDKERFLNSIYKSMWLDKDVTEISFSLFENGRLNTVISSNRERFGKENSANLKVFNDQKFSSETVRTSIGNVLVVISPLYISGQLEGTIEVNLSLREVERGITSSAMRLFSYYFVILVCFIVLNYSFLRWQIISPVLDLKSAATEIGKGNYSFRIKNKIKEDEIGELAMAFNDMAINLKTTHGELQTKVREITEEQARLVASINSLSFGFIVTNTRHTIVLKNIAVSVVLEMSEDSVSVEKITETLKTHVNVKTLAEQCMKEKKIIELKEVSYRDKILRVLFAPILITPNHGEVIGYVILFEDITEAKLLERTREEFFSIASHELRTPLTVIRGNASLIEDFYMKKIKDNTVGKMVSDIHEASIRLIKIVGDFLEISRLEQKKVKFEKKEFDGIGLIHEVIDELKEIALGKGLYLRFNETEKSEITITADRDRIKQVLFNLITNAVNYTDTGGIVVSAWKEGSLFNVTVKDTGIGILPENQPLLFRKFQQAGKELFTRSVTRGTGLGLYISKLLVEGMGGTIKLFESHPDSGSTFGFTIPLSMI